MGRAMLIICAGVLVSLGIVSISTSNQGKMLNQATVTYADYTMAKNAAHTAIQMAMQEINKDEDNRGTDNYWPKVHNKSNPWEIVINGRNVSLYTEYEENEDGQLFDAEPLRLFSIADHEDLTVEVISQYEMSQFSDLVPDFEGALGVAAPADSYTFTSGGNATINGQTPQPDACRDMPTELPPIKASEKGDHNFDGFNTDSDPKFQEDSEFDYEPTDELIERLSNTDGVQYINGTYNGDMGSADDPGIYFVEDDNARITGGVREGWGILVIRTSGEMVIEEDDGSTLDLAGNFTFNGLVIFENADTFRGRGTPTINGSVLVGNPDYDPNSLDKTDIDISGNIEINYDCRGADYAKLAAANAVKQNLYKRIVSTENTNYNAPS